jgi:hypothetical protein
MKDKKVIILIVLGVAAAASLLWGTTSSPKRKQPAFSAPEISQAPQSVPTSAAAINRRAVRSKFKAWKRRPFQSSQVPGQSSNLVLNGIIGGKVPKAMIGDLMVGVGDKIGNNKVVAIKKDSVTLNDGTKDFELVMKQ